MTEAKPKPRTMSRTLQDLVETAERAVSKPASASNFNKGFLDALLAEFKRETDADMPVIDCAFAINLTLALQGVMQSIPGTTRATRFHILAGVLLPMVRSDLGDAIEYERRLRS